VRLKIWINAFIPKTVSGYTIAITAGRNVGKTAVPLPGIARLNPLNSFKNLDAGYLTDQRSFSNFQTASVRMQSLVELDLATPVSVFRTAHTSSGTTEVDTVTGATLGFGVADMTRCTFSTLRVVPATTRSRTYRTFPLGVPFTLGLPTGGAPTYEIDVDGAAGDPLVSAAADIDYEGTFEIDLLQSPFRCSVSFSGYLDQFPAYECCADLDGLTKCLFRSNPPPGNTVADLLGNASRRITGFVSFP
jgi:hypothetical protein